MKKSLEERFWSHVDKSGGPDACWLWTASQRQPGRYGKFSIGRKAVYAHQVAWELTNGPIPKGLDCCHSCDAKLCCNPAHMFIGTRKENMADLCRKGLQARGERMGSARLTEQDVLTIREIYRSGDQSQRQLAARYGVRQSAISRVINGVRWGWLRGAT